MRILYGRRRNDGRGRDFKDGAGWGAGSSSSRNGRALIRAKLRGQARSSENALFGFVTGSAQSRNRWTAETVAGDGGRRGLWCGGWERGEMGEDGFVQVKNGRGFGDF